MQHVTAVVARPLFGLRLLPFRFLVPRYPRALACTAHFTESDESRSESIENTSSVIQTATLAGKRVIICEDEGISQLQLRRALAKGGLNVVGTAPNGRVAVEIAAAQRPDIILMDIRMPEMDGMEAARRILAAQKTCVVMLTAFSDDEYRAEATAAGAAGYIVKPVTADTLLPSLKTVWSDYLEREKPVE